MPLQKNIGIIGISREETLILVVSTKSHFAFQIIKYTEQNSPVSMPLIPHKTKHPLANLQQIRIPSKRLII